MTKETLKHIGKATLYVAGTVTSVLCAEIQIKNANDYAEKVATEIVALFPKKEAK
jgi:hypothetical protein